MVRRVPTLCDAHTSRPLGRPPTGHFFLAERACARAAASKSRRARSSQETRLLGVAGRSCSIIELEYIVSRFGKTEAGEGR